MQPSNLYRIRRVGECCSSSHWFSSSVCKLVAHKCHVVNTYALFVLFVYLYTCNSRNSKIRTTRLVKLYLVSIYCAYKRSLWTWVALTMEWGTEVCYRTVYIVKCRGCLWFTMICYIAYGFLPIVGDSLSFIHALQGKVSACNARDPGSISGSGRSPGEGNGNPLQCSGLENPMDRSLPVQGVSKFPTRLSD